MKRNFWGALLDKLGAKIYKLFVRVTRFLKPDPIIWKGAGWGLVGILIVLLIIMAVFHLKSLGILVILLIFLFFIGNAILGAIGLHFGLKLIGHIPVFYRFVLFVAIIVLINYWDGNTQARIALISSTIFTGSILGGVLAVLLFRRWKNFSPGKRILNMFFLVLGVGGLAIGFTWLFIEGFKTDPPKNAALLSEYRPDHIALQDPSLEGEYSVLDLTYGSGKDKHRDEFGDKVIIKTDSVDGNRYVSNWKKFHGWARTRYWGFDEKALPLNARVWFPGGKGSFPLVLIVHGNHNDRDFSDPGYEYLGRLMASRGFIIASIDQNFLNSSWSDVFDHLKEENDCRAWLLLKHLELWREWNKDPKNPFYGKVDMDNIGLIGHSRGGEAVAIAACFNQLPHNPDDATLAFNFNFKLRSVIAIAPVDGQYKPAGTGTFFENVSYLVIHGSNDMDMRTYDGARQYQRIEFSDNSPHVKAGLYIYGANHGQFNTIWGRDDNGYPYKTLFNKREIMTGENQEKIGKVFISAFLEATLKNSPGYFSLFRDYRTGLDWLPETVYLNQYEDSDCDFICNFDEDIDVKTTTIYGGQIHAENLTVWKERVVPLKWNNQATRAVYAGWNLAETDSIPGILSIQQKGENRIGTNINSHFYFVMADAKEDSNPHPKYTKQDKRNGKDPENDQKEPIDLTLEVVDSAGQIAALPLSAYSFLSRQLEPKIMKADFMTDVAKSDLVFQVFYYPLEKFLEQNPRLDIGHIQEVRFIFDRTEEGVVVIDNIGFWKNRSDAAN